LTGLADLQHVYDYHDGTKHHFDHFAPSLGYLDWASQPRLFRSFAGAPVFKLYPGPPAASDLHALPRETYDQLFVDSPNPAAPITAASIGHFLRYSLGLSAWKAFKGSRWPLRVNPSSGNLHPTEAYIVTGAFGSRSSSDASRAAIEDFGETPGVWHYAADRHAIERRCAFAPEAWNLAGLGGPTEAFIVALTSIHWREAWKYGERAFRYCQHDLGHAIAALGLSASMCGWRLRMLPAWPQRTMATLTGIDRDEDYFEAEREEPGCALLVTRVSVPGSVDRGVGFPDLGVRLLERRGLGEGGQPDLNAFLTAVRQARWFGRASQLSEDHVAWTFIDEVARATEDPGHTITAETATHALRQAQGGQLAVSAVEPIAAVDVDRGLDARALVLQRRSAVALDGASFSDRGEFLRMLSRVMPGPGAPWDAQWWPPCIHLALFVHRVDGIAPGLYVLARAASAVPRLQAAFSRAFAWTPVAGPGEDIPLRLLQAGDYRSRSQRVSCDQAIAADGFFSLGMIAICTAPRFTGIFSGSQASWVRCYISKRRPRARARPASAAFTTIPFTICSASKATRFRASITSRLVCRSRTRGSQRSRDIPGRRG
jgi:SagB-type dehydrogenase family enzyme